MNWKFLMHFSIRNTLYVIQFTLVKRKYLGMPLSIPNIFRLFPLYKFGTELHPLHIRAGTVLMNMYRVVKCVKRHDIIMCILRYIEITVISYIFYWIQNFLYRFLYLFKLLYIVDHYREAIATCKITIIDFD